MVTLIKGALSPFFGLMLPACFFAYGAKTYFLVDLIPQGLLRDHWRQTLLKLSVNMENSKANRINLVNSVKSFPETPGVYLMRNSKDEIIYIGKAKNIRSRVKSYFSVSAAREVKTSHLVKRIHRIETITTTTEYEALILENNLIKKWKPRYNISLKDCKTFPVIRITNEDFPRIFRTRKIIDDGSLYFGPYPDVKSIDTYLELIKKQFKIRKCREIPLKKRKSPCLYYHMGQCSAPCVGKADINEYRAEVKTISRILSGDTDSLAKEYSEKMAEASLAMDYEKAAWYRDILRSLRAFTEEQKVEGFSSGKKDFTALMCRGINCTAVVLQMRDGKLSGKSVFNFTSCSDNTENITKFLIQYYTGYFSSAEKDEFVPERIVVNIKPEKELLERFFTENLEHSAETGLPEDEKEASIMKMAEENCLLELAGREKELSMAQALQELKKRLGLGRIPMRIEGFDIAHLSGRNTAASMVSFYNGKPDKSGYRIFRMKSLPGGEVDDYASIREAVARRYTRLSNEGEQLPDLVLIDGGRGQLNAALKVLEALGLEGVDVAALAKQEELVFVPGKSEPVRLPEASLQLRILQHVRDEAHRFATSFNKRMRKNEISFSLLESVPGIGPERSKKILREFGSIENIMNSDSYTISEKASLPLKVAESVISYLKDNRKPS